ncbi:unnamed protein product, partial [Rotaria magnacalcarata]
GSSNTSKIEIFAFFVDQNEELKVWFSNRRAKYRRQDKVKGRRQHQQQLMNDMGENTRPSGATPPPSSVYPQMFPSNNHSI